MPLRVARWFRAQFVDAHTWRDVDLVHWWQMPNDETRTTSPWLQLPVDLITRATFSDWHDKVAVARVRGYDRLRPYVARLAFLLAITVALVVLDARWWCLVLLIPGWVQVVLEIYLYRFIHRDTEPRWEIVRDMRDMADEHHQTKLLNVTGLLGVLACPLNVVAVAISPPGGDLAAVKIISLAAATLYVNSGLASSFLDPANYTETSTMPPIMHRVRPAVPLLSLAVVVAIVAVGHHYGRWEPEMLPLAYAAATLTLLLGVTIRNHDRVVAAAAGVAREAVIDARRELGGVVHDDLNAAKSAVRVVRAIPQVPYREAIDLAAFEAYLTHLSARVGIDASPTLSIEDLVEKIASPYGLGPGDITCTITWPADIRRENQAVAIRMATALVHNAGQALHKGEHLDSPKIVEVAGFTTGAGHDLKYHLAVRDHLPLVAPQRWCTDGSTLESLRDWLDDTFDGELNQEDMGDGTKRIIASWRDRPPVRSYGWDETAREAL
ncbi:hypothetical protein C6A86_023560 [Mycobacterium sp. ITM-2016-00316]|uniref:hypothetical protein n=1 Tax=Mycobacterium sp. ITM-2016-00316 TaxID=2099695 RepID=UPI00115A2CDF|nr:hypothetical protein [Mycobacterium sp. ITM-2016-00316]WNG81139.1 hypothetical protein C6A86_023560 [Mycobacterium sp. ITM-2016-00316]